MRTNAEVIDQSSLQDRIISGYASYVVSALAVWVDIEGERGHWVEVQPPNDPVGDISVVEKAYVLAVPPDDPVLRDWAEKGWFGLHGGGQWSSVVTLTGDPLPLDEAIEVRNRAWSRDAAWLAENCEHNALGDVFKVFSDPKEIPRRKKTRGNARIRVGRMQLALMIWIHAVEGADPELAKRARRAIGGLGWMQALVGDEETLDYRTEAVHARMREDMKRLAAAAAEGIDVEEAFVEMLTNYLDAQRGGFF